MFESKVTSQLKTKELKGSIGNLYAHERSGRQININRFSTQGEGLTNRSRGVANGQGNITGETDVRTQIEIQGCVELPAKSIRRNDQGALSNIN